MSKVFETTTHSRSHIHSNGIVKTVVRYDGGRKASSPPYPDPEDAGTDPRFLKKSGEITECIARG